MLFVLVSWPVIFCRQTAPKEAVDGLPNLKKKANLHHMKLTHQTKACLRARLKPL
jgi:hypothetical protein